MTISRAAFVLLTSFTLTTGCSTTGGKFFGTVAVASAIGGGYMLGTGSTTIEDGELVHHGSRQSAGVVLVFASLTSTLAWFYTETKTREPSYGSSGGGTGAAGGFPANVEPEPASGGETADPPAVVVIRDRGGRDAWKEFSRGWRVDPATGEHRFQSPSGELIGYFDVAGYIWDASSAALGRVDMSPGCGVACRRAQARQVLLSR